MAARRKTNAVARAEALIEAAELCENGARTYETVGPRLASYQLAAQALRITAKELRSRAQKEK